MRLPPRFALISLGTVIALGSFGCNEGALKPDASATADMAVTLMTGDWAAGGAVSFSQVALDGVNFVGDVDAGAVDPGGHFVSQCLIFMDLDGDDRPDVFLVPRLADFDDHGLVFHNLGGKSFDKGQMVPFKAMVGGNECAAGDYDNDGLPDIFITSYAGSMLLHNEGNLKFKDVTVEAGFGTLQDHGRAAAFLDYDADGKLDFLLAAVSSSDPSPLDQQRGLCTAEEHRVYCKWPTNGLSQQASRLYRNIDGNHFQLVDNAAGAVNTPDPGSPSAIGVMDWNFDGYPDLFFANDFSQDYFYVNDTNGFFNDISVEAGLPGFNNAMGVSFADLDGDGLLDFYIAELGNPQLWMGQKPPAMPYAVNRAAESGIEQVTRAHSDWGPSSGDYNADGWVDVFVPSSAVVDNVPDDFTFIMRQNDKPDVKAVQEDTLFVNAGSAKAFAVQHFAHVPQHHAAFTIAASATADFDGDGALDIAEVYGVNATLSFRLLHNDMAGAGHSFQVKLIGTHSNKTAVGATLIITAGGRTQLRQISASPGSIGKPSLVAHFGLGKYDTVDHLKIIWPGGKTQEMNGPLPTGKVLTVTEQ